MLASTLGMELGEEGSRITVTLAAIAAILIFRVSLGHLINRKLGGLVGHQNITNLLSSIFTVGLAFYLLSIWGVIPRLMELLAAIGALGAVLLFALKDIWISNIFAGISLIGDKSIDIGTEVQIAGVRGKIVEMTLTVTKVKTDDGRLMMVPNKKFREDVVIIEVAEQ